jgi:hypothetical protein
MLERILSAAPNAILFPLAVCKLTLNVLCFHHGLIQLSRTFNQPLDYLRKLALIQLRRGGNQL